MASMRHNRKRKRGRRRFGLLFKLLCGAALVAAATLGATVFFQVETIAVVGNSRYTAQEVIDASGVQIGDNLFQMNKNQISQQILQRLPYVGGGIPPAGAAQHPNHPGDGDLRRRPGGGLSGTIRRRQSRRRRTGPGTAGRRTAPPRGDSSQAEGEATQTLADQPWLISASGKLLEAAPEGSGALSVTGLTVLAPQAGTMLAVPQGAAVPADHAEGAALRPGGGWGAGSGLLH